MQEAITGCHQSHHLVVEGQLRDIVDGIAADFIDAYARRMAKD